MSVTDYEQLAKQAAVNAGIDPAIFGRQIKQESGFNPTARSGAGALGIAQIMPGTAKGWGVDPMDPRAALNAAAGAMAKYVHSYGGDYAKALAAYNAGPGNVAKYHGVPPFKETQNYVHTILDGAHPQTTHAAASATSSTSSGTTSTSHLEPRFSPLEQAGLQLVFKGNQPMQSLANLAALATHAVVDPGVPAPAKTAAADAVVSGPGTNYLSLLAWGKRNFGLKQDDPNPRDPNNAQTIGGDHVAGSNHYAHLADDFGTAKNDRQTLNAVASYAHRHPEQFKELFFNPLGWGIKDGKIVKGLTVAGHDNHMHIAVFAKAPTGKRAA